MAGLPLAQFVSLGFKLAKELVPDALTPGCTVRLGPTTTVNPVTDQAVKVWAVEVPNLTLLAYDDSDERKVLPVNVKQRSFLMDPSDYPPGAPFDQNGQVVASGITWEIYRAEVVRGAVVVFYARA